MFLRQTAAVLDTLGLLVLSQWQLIFNFRQTRHELVQDVLEVSGLLAQLRHLGFHVIGSFSFLYFCDFNSLNSLPWSFVRDRLRIVNGRGHLFTFCAGNVLADTNGATLRDN